MSSIPTSITDRLAAGELIAAIAQDAENKEVLMMAWMNLEALEKTLDTKRATYWSRSRSSLWVKGETSGHFQEVLSLTYDCDSDCGHCDCDKDNSSEIDWRHEALKMKLATVISAHIDQGIYPSLNYIMTSTLSNYDVTYDELADIIFELDYDTNEGILKSDNTRITAAEASIVESF